jgi:hypothetical protein
MKLQFIDIIFCCFAYIVLIFFVIKRYHRKNSHIDNDPDDDDEGGIEINNLPDLDLPPGICLPPDPDGKTKFDKEFMY